MQNKASRWLHYEAEKAKKLRQIVGLADPTPVAAVLVEGKDGGEGKGKGRACSYSAEKRLVVGEAQDEEVEETDGSRRS